MTLSQCANCKVRKNICILYFLKVTVIYSMLLLGVDLSVQSFFK